MPAIFEIYSDRSGEFRFRLKAPNGEVIAVSEGYSTKINCISGIDSVRINAATAHVVELNPDRELLASCATGDLIAARKALARGADPNAIDREGKSALNNAAESGNLKLVRLLAQKKANINYANFNGETALHEAAEEGHEDIMGFLIKLGANINTMDNRGNTPLHKALAEKKAGVARILVATGAKTNLPNNMGMTPEMLARERGIILPMKRTPVKKAKKK